VARVFVTRTPVGNGLLERAQRADALLCRLGDRIDAAFLDASPHRQVIASYAVGLDDVDLTAARAHGIAIDKVLAGLAGQPLPHRAPAPAAAP
jgi:lactate dehydrogenase-like 2-hydroxyacid dehydrogenase